MIRTLITTTAVAAFLTSAAIAQTTAPANPEPTVGQQVDNALDAAGNAMGNAGDAMKDAAQNAGQAVDNTLDNAGQAIDNTVDNAGAAANQAAHDASVALDNATRPVFDLSAGYTVADTDNLGTRLIGQPVYSSTGDDAEEIGTINDIVFTNDGTIAAVVLGVGGFLGIGEKSVAVDFRSLDFTIAADNTERWVLPTTADALTNAPDFVWREDSPADTTAVDVAPAPAVSQ